MIDTLTIFDGRVAQSFDYPDNRTLNGESMRIGPANIGGTALAIDIDPKTGAIRWIKDLDTLVLRRIDEWPARIAEAIRAHARAYVAKHANRGGASRER